MGYGEMPKEKIQSTDTPEFSVSVSWNRDQTVQIVTGASDADDRLRGWTEIEGSDGPVSADDPRASKPGSSFKLFYGWHAGLDRQGVNELIRVLRRARPGVRPRRVAVLLASTSPGKKVRTLLRTGEVESEVEAFRWWSTTVDTPCYLVDVVATPSRGYGLRPAALRI